jgi:hypothetical protein
VVELRLAAERIKAAARSQHDAARRYEQVRARRSLRWWTEPDGTFRLDGRLTPDAGARVVAAIEPEARRIFKQAWADGRREPFVASVADALVDVVTGSGSGTKGSPFAIVRVDLAALRRGELADGEICEIPGVGPVPLSVARELLGEALLKIVITNGVDVQTVCHAGRGVSRFIDTALSERDPVCVVPGCDNAAFLERDHWQESFAEGGPTDLANLCRLCTVHHRLKHKFGFSLRGGPGKWEWIAPKDCDTADHACEVPTWPAGVG